MHNVFTGETIVANRHNMPFTSNQFSDYLGSWDTMKQKKKSAVQFCAKEWFMVGHNFKSIKEAKDYKKNESLRNSKNQ